MNHVVTLGEVLAIVVAAAILKPIARLALELALDALFPEPDYPEPPAPRLEDLA